MASDVKNAFLTAPNKEKCWIRAGPELGPLEGKPFIVRAALYGLKSASTSFRVHMAAKLDEMNFTSCNTYPDVWHSPSFKCNGDKYYEKLLTYVDDLLAISEDATRILKEIANTFKL